MTATLTEILREVARERIAAEREQAEEVSIREYVREVNEVSAGRS